MFRNRARGTAKYWNIYQQILEWLNFRHFIHFIIQFGILLLFNWFWHKTWFHFQSFHKTTFRFARVYWMQLIAIHRKVDRNELLYPHMWISRAIWNNANSMHCGILFFFALDYKANGKILVSAYCIAVKWINLNNWNTCFGWLMRFIKLISYSNLLNLCEVILLAVKIYHY